MKEESTKQLARGVGWEAVLGVHVPSRLGYRGLCLFVQLFTPCFLLFSGAVGVVRAVLLFNVGLFNTFYLILAVFCGHLTLRAPAGLHKRQWSMHAHKASIV